MKTKIRAVILSAIFIIGYILHMQETASSSNSPEDSMIAGCVLVVLATLVMSKQNKAMYPQRSG